jgi:hypothetical protein
MRFVDRAREAWRSLFVSGAERDAKAGRISRPLLTRRVLIVLSVVVGFTIPTATVIGAAAQRLHQAQSDATLHENGLRILASVGALDRQLRHLRADAIAPASSVRSCV